MIVIYKIQWMANYNFREDLKNEIYDIVEQSGLKISIDQNIHRILIDFYNLKSKILEVKKRTVFIVPSFEEEIKMHPKKDEIETIIRIARDGENLNSFQSERIIETKFIDHLSNEWNIFHFHLSLKPQKKEKFVKRGDLLLFAYIDGENVVFLGVAKHKDSFSDIKWLEKLELNFPLVLKKFIPYDLPEMGQNFSTLERKLAWEAGLSSGYVKLNGRTYLSPGIGKLTSGHNILVVKQSNDILNWIVRIEDVIEKQMKEYFSNDTSLKLRFGERTIEIYDSYNGVSVFEFPRIEMII